MSIIISPSSFVMPLFFVHKNVMLVRPVRNTWLNNISNQDCKLVVQFRLRIKAVNSKRMWRLLENKSTHKKHSKHRYFNYFPHSRPQTPASWNASDRSLLCWLIQKSEISWQNVLNKCNSSDIGSHSGATGRQGNRYYKHIK